MALSYSRFYPDIAFEDALRPEALEAGREIARLCAFVPVEDRRRVAELMATFDGPSLATDRNPALAARLDENTADHPIAAPLLVVQGRRDIVVPAVTVTAFVEARCAAGQRLEYWIVKRADHAGVVRANGLVEDPLFEWTAARFAGQPQPPGCTRRSF